MVGFILKSKPQNIEKKISKDRIASLYPLHSNKLIEFLNSTFDIRQSTFL